MSGFRVGVAALSSPTQRLKQISLDLGTAGSGAATAAGSGGGAAGDPAVVSAAAVFEAGVRAVLGALGDDAGLLGDKVQRAGITYETTDANAMPTAPGGGSSGPGGTQPSAFTDPGGSGPGGPGGSGGPGGPGGPNGPSGTGGATAPSGTAPTGAAPTGTAPSAPTVSADQTGTGGTTAPEDPTGTGGASATAAADSPPPALPPPATVQVAPGDSLWAIAARTLGPGASDSALAAESHRWYAANRDLIGSDPNLIHTGITLRAPEGTR